MRKISRSSRKSKSSSFSSQPSYYIPIPISQVHTYFNLLAQTGISKWICTSLAFECLLPVTKKEKFKRLPAFLLMKQRSYTEQFYDFNSYRINQNILKFSVFIAVCFPAQYAISMLFYIQIMQTNFSSTNDVYCQFSKKFKSINPYI